MNSVESPGISIVVRSSLAGGNNELISDHLGFIAESYEHTVEAAGGYTEASLSFPVTPDEGEDWLLGGLARHVEVRDESQQIIWEGFVNEVTYNSGPISASRGPLLDVTNRCKVTYTTKEYTITGGISFGGDTITTSVANDTDSQGKYGVLENNISGGELNEDLQEGEQMRDMYLQQYAWPNTTQELTLGGNSPPRVEISLVGYVRLLERYYYTAVDANTSENLSAKLTSVLNASPNISFYGVKSISTNTLQVPHYEDGTRTAWTIIQELLAHGDSSFGRYLFGVYAGREIIYEAVEYDVSYLHQLQTSTGHAITDMSGGVLRPWEIKPGRFLSLSDIYVGQSIKPVGTLSDTIIQDPRIMFIESVRYSAPWGLVLSGGKVNRIDQLLAQKGLGSV